MSYREYIRNVLPGQDHARVSSEVQVRISYQGKSAIVAKQVSSWAQIRSSYTGQDRVRYWEKVAMSYQANSQ